MFNQFMNEPVQYEVTTKDILNHYFRCRNKAETAKAFCITVKDLNNILKSSTPKEKKKDSLYDIGMSQKDFLVWMMKYKIGDHVLIVENTSQISEVTIIGISGGLYTVRFNTERPSAIEVCVDKNNQYCYYKNVKIL